MPVYNENGQLNIDMMEFTLTGLFKSSAENIYNTWLNSAGHSDMTGGAATITNKIGNEFTAWDGYITGKILELETNKRILQTWRTSEFEANEEDSLVEILLNEIDGQTELTLIHTKLPVHGDQYKKGWEDHYFIPMKEYFSKP